MLSLFTSSLTSRVAKMSCLLVLALTLSVGGSAACGGEPQLGPGDGASGRLLGVLVNEVRRTQEVRYSSPMGATAGVDGLLLTVTNAQGR